MSPDQVADHTPKTLLLVEDEQSVLRAFAHAFERYGYEVLRAFDVTEALTHWERAGDRVSIIVSDVMMPGPPIEDLIARVRERTPSVPILLMSGELRGTEERIRNLMASVDGFIPKPLRLEALRLEVERQLKK